MTALRLAFFGTPEFAVPTLERLLASRHAVVAVVSQPDRARGRGRKTSPSPVARLAERAEVTLLRPERVGDPECESALRRCAPELGVVVAYGQFVPRRIRELPSLGYLINGHASLLPKLRGAAPVAHAILAGESHTGVSVMRLVREMDAGPVAARVETPIGDDEDAGTLAARLAQLCGVAIAGVLDEIEAGRVVWTPQDDSRASYAPKLSARDARLDWRESARALARRVRALSPRPGAYTRLDGERLRILAARAEPGPVALPPGVLSHAPHGPLRVATGEGWLVPLRVQRAGGRPLPIEAFLRGHPVADGARLEAAS